MSSRPAAFSRGAMRKATSSDVGAIPAETPDSARRARSPGARQADSAARPLAAMTRFSPASGTMSAIVPRAAARSSDATESETPARRPTASASFSAIPAAARSSGIAAAGLSRVDDDRSVGQLARHEMVIRDDDVDSRRPRARDALAGRDPAVDRHDHGRGELREDAPDRVRPEAVAVAQPVRDERRGVGAHAAQRGAQLRHRGHSVDVVVAEDDDAPSRRAVATSRSAAAAAPSRSMGSWSSPSAGAVRARLLRRLDAAPTAAGAPRRRRRPRGPGEHLVLLRGFRDEAPDGHGLSFRRAPGQMRSRAQFPSNCPSARNRRYRRSRRCLRRQVRDLAEVSLDRLADGRGRAGRVGVRAARRLRHDLVDDAEPLEVGGRDLHRLRGVRLRGRVLPEDRRAALRRDDGVDRRAPA